jgi:hypothetical protein
LRGSFADYCWQAWFEYHLNFHKQALDSIDKALNLFPRHESATQFKLVVLAALDVGEAAAPSDLDVGAPLESNLTGESFINTPKGGADATPTKGKRTFEESRELYRKEQELLRMIRIGSRPFPPISSDDPRPAVLEQRPLYGRWE